MRVREIPLLMLALACADTDVDPHAGTAPEPLVALSPAPCGPDAVDMGGTCVGRDERRTIWVGFQRATFAARRLAGVPLWVTNDDLETFALPDACTLLDAEVFLPWDAASRRVFASWAIVQEVLREDPGLATNLVVSFETSMASTLDGEPVYRWAPTLPPASGVVEVGRGLQLQEQIDATRRGDPREGSRSNCLSAFADGTITADLCGSNSYPLCVPAGVQAALRRSAGVP